MEEYCDLYDFPENLPLYKDSGLWQLRSENMNDVLVQQKLCESTNDFINRCREYQNTL